MQYFFYSQTEQAAEHVIFIFTNITNTTSTALLLATWSSEGQALGSCTGHASPADLCPTGQELGPIPRRPSSHSPVTSALRADLATWDVSCPRRHRGTALPVD